MDKFIERSIGCMLIIIMICFVSYTVKEMTRDNKCIKGYYWVEQSHGVYVRRDDMCVDTKER